LLVKYFHEYFKRTKGLPYMGGDTLFYQLKINIFVMCGHSHY
jgi:hypothetical protein